MLRGGEPCIVSAHRCCTLRLFCRWHCLGHLRVWRAAQRVVPRLRAPARPASDCRMCTRSGQCRQMSPEDMRRPSGSHRRPGGSRVCLHGQELERVAYVRVLTGGGAQVHVGRRQGVAHRDGRVARAMGRRWQCEASIRFCLEWSHEMLQH